MRGLRWVVAWTLLYGCSGHSTEDGTAIADAAASGPRLDAGTSLDAGTPIDGAPGSSRATDAGAASDGASSVADATADSSSGGDASVIGSRPPSGFTRCGQGTFTDAEAKTACETASAFPGDTPDPRACGSVSTSGGAWEVWCEGATTSNGQIYLYVRFDGLVSPAVPTCPDSTGSELSVGSGAVEIDSGGQLSGSGERVSIAGGPQLITTGLPTSMAFDGTFAGLYFPSSGAAHVWISDQMICLGDSPRATFTGASIAWGP